MRLLQERGIRRAGVTRQRIAVTRDIKEKTATEELVTKLISQ
jgi:hypothetical protein